MTSAKLLNDLIIINFLRSALALNPTRTKDTLASTLISHNESHTVRSGLTGNFRTRDITISMPISSNTSISPILPSDFNFSVVGAFSIVIVKVHTTI